MIVNRRFLLSCALLIANTFFNLRFLLSFLRKNKCILSWNLANHKKNDNDAEQTLHKRNTKRSQKNLYRKTKLYIALNTLNFPFKKDVLLLTGESFFVVSYLLTKISNETFLQEFASNIILFENVDN